MPLNGSHMEQAKVAVNRPIKDMNCRTGQAGRESSSVLLLQSLPPVRCGQGWATSEVKLVTYEVEDFFGDQL